MNKIFTVAATKRQKISLYNNNYKHSQFGGIKTLLEEIQCSYMINHAVIQHLYELKMLMLYNSCKILLQLNGQNSNHALSLPQQCSFNYLIWIFDIRRNGPGKQRELLLCNIRGCSYLIVVSRSLHPLPDSMFSSMQSPPMEPQTSALKLRC